MGVYLHKTGYHAAEADPDTGELIRGAGNDYEKVVGELAELRGDYVPITLNRDKPNEVTVLLDRITTPWESPFTRGDGSRIMIEDSTLDPTGLVPSFCDHGEAAHPVTGAKPGQGVSWVRGRLLTVIRGTLPPQVACHCECFQTNYERCKSEASGEACPVRLLGETDG